MQDSQRPSPQPGPPRDKNRVLVFGTFDQFHPGHDYFLRKAKQQGDYLIVITTRSSVVKKQKGRKPVDSSTKRLARVLSHAAVDEGRLGDKNPTDYAVLEQATFATIAVGYDQTPSNREIQAVLQKIGKPYVQIVRLPAYEPAKFKSSIVRDKMKK